MRLNTGNYENFLILEHLLSYDATPFNVGKAAFNVSVHEREGSGRSSNVVVSLVSYNGFRISHLFFPSLSQLIRKKITIDSQ
jgi:hypothetical protein